MESSNTHTHAHTHTHTHTHTRTHTELGNTETQHFISLTSKGTNVEYDQSLPYSSCLIKSKKTMISRVDLDALGNEMSPLHHVLLSDIHAAFSLN